VTQRPRIPGTPSTRVLYVLPDIPDDAPERLKNALAVRNTCAVEGRCPGCGTEGELRELRRHVFSWTFRHDDGCPALLDEDAA
jgi:hypothetical protein